MLAMILAMPPASTPRFLLHIYYLLLSVYSGMLRFMKLSACHCLHVQYILAFYAPYIYQRQYFSGRKQYYKHDENKFTISKHISMYLVAFTQLHICNAMSHLYQQHLNHSADVIMCIAKRLNDDITDQFIYLLYHSS